MFTLRRAVITLQQQDIFHQAVVELGLGLRHGVVRLASGVLDIFIITILFQYFGHMTGLLSDSSPWPLQQRWMPQADKLNGVIKRLPHIFCCHACAQAPCKNEP